jgi:hypothetical protein
MAEAGRRRVAALVRSASLCRFKFAGSDKQESLRISGLGVHWNFKARPELQERRVY